ncbi:N-acetyltransferase family protein [Nocardioides sp. SYSU DS0651]|uniref:GNAT family N-acetyltransferase n=1 Tax=Nocardioides sp. SYSU DS0651 TaxID=3415955 RepID=UPI003F4C7770
MSRYSLSPRVATREDAPVLAELWSDVLRRADRSEQVADLELIIKSAAASPEQRVVVVDYDGQPAGAVYLRLTTLSPLNLDASVQAIHPRVFDRYRRHGVGRALMEAAVSFAEENGVLHVATAVPQTSREANRFMARLGLAPVASYRAAPTTLLRSRVSPQRNGEAGRSNKVLAARRSLRRSRGTDRLPLPGQDPVAPE